MQVTTGRDFVFALLVAEALGPRSSTDRLPLPLLLPQTQSPGRWDSDEWCSLKSACPWTDSTREPSGLFSNLSGSLFVADGNSLRVNGTIRICLANSRQDGGLAPGIQSHSRPSSMYYAGEAGKPDTTFPRLPCRKVLLGN